MALKDLVADHSKLTEAAIESIVRDYIRYDPAAYEIVLTPAGRALSNDAKVLLLLVAIAGWQYVVDETRLVDTRPSALEHMTGIPGGTLRPTLKKLKDAHFLTSTGDGYAIRVANLDAIGRVIAGEKAVVRSVSRTSKRPPANEENNNTKDAHSARRNGADAGRRKTGVPIRNSLANLIDSDFFAEQRTLSQVVTRLHEMAIIAKSSSLSGPIAEMVRSGRLVRKKVTEGGKDVWSYRTPPHA